MSFEFATAARIVFGPGSFREVAPAVRAMGRRALVVKARSAPAIEGVAFCVAAEPTVATVREGVAAAREAGCDVVAAIGGGSAIDAGKAIAALLANGGDPLDYLEVVGRGQALRLPSAPFIAAPTTAGTGSEVTRNAVLGSPEHGVKASLRGAGMLARLAVVDPDLTRELPPPITATTGLDALTQLIEPYVSVRASPVTDGLCVEGIRRAAGALCRACEGDATAREDMALASLFGGLALANAGLGAVHGFAAPIGGMFPAPHGAVCAVLLPHVMEVNVRALRARAPDSAALRRYATVAELLCGRPQPEDGVEWVRRLCETLRIPPLAAYGVTESHLPELVRKATAASSMKANPVVLTAEELTQAARAAL